MGNKYESAITNTPNSLKYSASKLIKRYELLENKNGMDKE